MISALAAWRDAALGLKKAPASEGGRYKYVGATIALEIERGERSVLVGDEQFAGKGAFGGAAA